MNVASSPHQFLCYSIREESTFKLQVTKADSVEWVTCIEIFLVLYLQSTEDCESLTGLVIQFIPVLKWGLMR